MTDPGLLSSKPPRDGVSQHSVRSSDRRADPTIERREPLISDHFFEKGSYRVERPRGLTDDWLVVLTTGGCGYVDHAEGRDGLPASHVLLLRPGAPHTYGTHEDVGRWDLLWAHFRPPADWLSFLNWPERSPGVSVLALDSPDIRKRVNDQLAQCNRILRGYDARRYLLATHMLAIALLWCDQQNVSRRQAIDKRVADAADLICRNLDKQLTLADIAGHCSLSPSRLRHLFTDQMSLSPQQFQEQQRMIRARQLLQVSNHSVAEIAYQVGFEDPFYFSTRFKKSTGESPRAFRDKFARG